MWKGTSEFLYTFLLSVLQLLMCLGKAFTSISNTYQKATGNRPLSCLYLKAKPHQWLCISYVMPLGFCSTKTVLQLLLIVCESKCLMSMGHM